MLENRAEPGPQFNLVAALEVREVAIRLEEGLLDQVGRVDLGPQRLTEERPRRRLERSMNRRSRAMALRPEIAATPPRTAMVMAAGLGKRMRPLGLADEREVPEQVIEQQRSRGRDLSRARPLRDRRQGEVLCRLIQQPRPAPSDDDLLAMRRAAWRSQGVVVLRPEDVRDDWTRQALINEANRLYGRRPGHPR